MFIDCYSSNMSNLHNELVRLFLDPTYKNFRNSTMSQKVPTKDDAGFFLKTGSHLFIGGSQQLMEPSLPYSYGKRYMIRASAMEGYAKRSIGVDYFLKGVFLHTGFAINHLKLGATGTEPLTLAHSSDLDPNNSVGMDYFKRNLPKIIDFKAFHNRINGRNDAKRTESKKHKLIGIDDIHYRSLNSVGMMEYLDFSRDQAAHHLTNLPEFMGVSREVVEFLDYVAQQVPGIPLKELANLELDNA